MARTFPIIAALSCIVFGCRAASAGPPQAGPALEAALARPDAWFHTDDAAVLADHLVTWQNANGGWWKTYDPNTARPAALPEPAHDDGPPGDTEADWRGTSTIDNGATYTELRLLARVYDAQRRDADRVAFEKGLKFLFDAQYANGGWPQRFPLEANYGRRITFNDDAMTEVLRLMRDVADARPGFAFVDDATRGRARAALERGIDCVLRCQIVRDGRPTGWCQQHDEVTLAPCGARTFELPSVSGNETSGLVMLLMEIERPDARVRAAVEGAAAWYEEAKITGKRVEAVSGSRYENGKDRVLVDDPAAPPLWARFYDLETNRPFFASRDGVKRDDYATISWERRNKYSWFGTWGDKVLRAHAKWKQTTVK